MSLIAKLRFDPSRPVIARAACRAMIGSLNFSMVNLIQQHLRQQRFGVAMPEAGGIDALNDAMATDEASIETARIRAEQGFSLNEEPLVLAAKLKVVRDAMAEDLLANAARRAMVTDPSKTLPDQFHIGASFEESLEFQLRMAPRVNEAQIKAEAKAINVSEAEIREALVSRHQRQLNYLKENQADIIKTFRELEHIGGDGHPVGTEADEVVFESLPPMVRLRLAASADKGLFTARRREIERHMTGNAEAAGNLGIIDGTRREILDEVARWLENPVFKGGVDEAVSRGSNMPQFAPAPHVQQPDEVEVARRKAA